jgi:hypothetical protein
MRGMLGSRRADVVGCASQFMAMCLTARSPRSPLLRERGVRPFSSRLVELGAPPHVELLCGLALHDEPQALVERPGRVCLEHAQRESDLRSLRLGDDLPKQLGTDSTALQLGSCAR